MTALRILFLEQFVHAVCLPFACPRRIHNSAWFCLWFRFHTYLPHARHKNQFLQAPHPPSSPAPTSCERKKVSKSRTTHRQAATSAATTWSWAYQQIRASRILNAGAGAKLNALIERHDHRQTWRAVQFKYPIHNLQSPGPTTHCSRVIDVFTL